MVKTRWSGPGLFAVATLHKVTMVHEDHNDDDDHDEGHHDDDDDGHDEGDNYLGVR